MKDLNKIIFPKILVLSRDVWNGSTSSTLDNIFENYNATKISHIYIETKKPNTKNCASFFQISEYSLIRRIFNRKIKTGQRIDSNYIENKSVEKKEVSIFNFVRNHRLFIYTVLRELLWLLNGWKTKELDDFIHEEQPDIIFFMGSPLILMNRLMRYIVRKTNKPYCIFEMDDVYSYRIQGFQILNRIYKYFLQKIVKNLMNGVSQLFVISPKMKNEYDKIFGTNSLILTKGIDYSKLSYKPYIIHNPIRLIYMGQIIYDRISTIIMISKIIDEINIQLHGQKIILKIYTNNFIDSKVKESITKNGNIQFCNPVPYSEINSILEMNDVLLFVESLNEKYKGIARLSFSTKITDYLSSGKCILAVGPSDIAPIEYLRNNDAALVASDVKELKQILTKLLDHKIIESYSKKAFECGYKNHNKQDIDQILFSKIIEISRNGK